MLLGFSVLGHKKCEASQVNIFSFVANSSHFYDISVICYVFLCFTSSSLIQVAKMLGFNHVYGLIQFNCAYISHVHFNRFYILSNVDTTIINVELLISF